MLRISNRASAFSSLCGAIGKLEAKSWFHSTIPPFSASSVNHVPSKPPEDLLRWTKYQEYRERQKKRYRTDPEFRRKESERVERWFKRRMEADPGWRMNHLASRRARAAETPINPRLAANKSLRRWITSWPWFRELCWKEHIPVVYPHRVLHHCSSCQLTRGAGVKSWWLRKGSEHSDQPEKWVCPGCFVKENWPNLMPIGYEGLTNAKELYARRAELGMAAAQDSSRDEISR